MLFNNLLVKHGSTFCVAMVTLDEPDKMMLKVLKVSTVSTYSSCGRLSEKKSSKKFWVMASVLADYKKNNFCDSVAFYGLIQIVKTQFGQHWSFRRQIATFRSLPIRLYERLTPENLIKNTKCNP